MRVSDTLTLNAQNYIISKGENYSIYIDGDGYLHVGGHQDMMISSITKL